MRPKIVILILVAAFGLLAVMVVLKGVMAEHSGNSGGQTPVTEANAGSQSAATNDQVVPVNPDSSNTAASSEQKRAAAIEKELDAIQEIVSEADGDNNPTIISALLEKVVHPEPVVRAAALDALKHLNDTNAVPGLQQAVEHIEDPRGKVAVLDVIDYLKLPNATPDVPPADLDTNIPDRKTMPPRKVNPKFEHKAMRNGRQTVPPNAPADQPQ